MTTIGIDPTFSKAYRLLFSDEPDSAEQMRAMLDEALKQKYGTHKTLTSILPKKLMVEEPLTNDNMTSPSQSPTENIDDPESEESTNSPENELNELNILEEDLLCVVCRQMMQSDGNRLVECQECHGLYHQECHQPPINEAEIPVNDPRLAWYCATCKKKLNKAISTIKNNKPVLSVPIPTSPKPSGSGGKPPFTSTKTFTSSVSKSSNGLSSALTS
ncbi:integrator complex subunit 12 [Frankliniella occidentalis]|uniref:Integrator complex subunit 12 n=1 Tax=Frankliniella occidentalis TaxID=133901 RepID=A0A6J1SWK1_FRAOC|nr:integrator complex subunit 12 [Frankliniella occidentalis]